MQQHVIHKQQIIIRSRVAGSGSQWQRRIDDQLQQQLLRGLETLFDELAPPGVFLRIDTLHLDLGPIAVDGFGGETGFGREFVEKVVEGCRNALLDRQADVVAYKTTVQQSSASERSLETLLFFLEKGRLPWYSEVKSVASWEREIVAGFGPNEWRALATWLRKSLVSDGLPTFLAGLGLRAGGGPGSGSPVLQRLIYQFSDGFLRELVVAVLGGRRVISLALEHAASLGLSGLSTAERLEKWAGVLALLLATDSEDASQHRRLPDAALKPPNQPADRRPRVEEEALYVESAGLVLFHPFLELYFAELGLLSGKRFKDEAESGRAVLLLHWLATGRTEAAEWELVLQKLLCGLAPDYVVPAQLDLSPEEEAESENVLRSVLGLWAPLKQSSPEALRDAFLQRQGRLAPKEGGWLLTVEKKTIDLLLGKLPWGFSTIRLPWMEGVLHVEW